MLVSAGFTCFVSLSYYDSLVHRFIALLPFKKCFIYIMGVKSHGLIQYLDCFESPFPELKKDTLYPKLV